MEKVSTAERLKELMEERGLRQIDILNLAMPFCKANRVKLGRSAIAQYLSGKVVPGQTKIFILAKALNVSEAWLSGFNVPKERADIQNETFKPYNPQLKKIPILGYISAGMPLYAEEHIEDYTYTDSQGEGEYFALRVKGDSMNAAHINDGNILIIRKQESVDNGEIAVVMVNDEDATVKRFKKENGFVQLIPQSFNPEHQIQIYNLKKDKIRILGKVVECKILF